MGCPPDPMEKSYGYGRDQLNEYEKKFNSLLTEINQTRSVINKLKFEEGLPADIKDFMEKVSAIHSSGNQLQNFTGSLYSGNQSWEEVLSDMYSALHFNEDKVKQKENELCVLRHALLQVYPYAGKLSPEVSAKLETERKLHITHREDDRQTWLSWLSDRRYTAEFFIKEREYEIDLSSYQNLVRNIDKEMERVKGLSVEELLKDRDIFGRNEKDFELPIKETGF